VKDADPALPVDPQLSLLLGDEYNRPEKPY